MLHSTTIHTRNTHTLTQITSSLTHTHTHTHTHTPTHTRAHTYTGQQLRWAQARIQESRLVKERLKAIDEPRSVLAQLNEAITAPKLDEANLERALSAASTLTSRADLVKVI